MRIAVAVMSSIPPNSLPKRILKIVLTLAACMILFPFVVMVFFVPIFANLFAGFGVDIPIPLSIVGIAIHRSSWIGPVLIVAVLLCGFWVLKALRRV